MKENLSIYKIHSIAQWFWNAHCFRKFGFVTYNISTIYGQLGILPNWDDTSLTTKRGHLDINLFI